MQGVMVFVRARIAARDRVIYAHVTRRMATRSARLLVCRRNSNTRKQKERPTPRPWQLPRSEEACKSTPFPKAKEPSTAAASNFRGLMNTQSESVHSNLTPTNLPAKTIWKKKLSPSSKNKLEKLSNAQASCTGKQNGFLQSITARPCIYTEDSKSTS